MTNLIFSFDDGRKDNLEVVLEILAPNNIPATFNLTTDYISNNLEEKEQPCKNEALSIGDIYKIKDLNMFEFAGHGKKHSNEFQNLIDGVLELRSMLQIESIVGIASPNSQADIDMVLKDEGMYRECKVSYFRLGDRSSPFNEVKKIIRKVNRKFFHIPFIYSLVHKHSLISTKDEFILYSIPVLHSDSIAEIVSIIRTAVKLDKSIILMFHSILKKDRDNYISPWSWDWHKFNELILIVKEMESSGMLRITTTSDFVRSGR